MDNRAKYYANLRTGKSVYLCARHVTKVARRIDDAGRMALKRGVRSIGSLNPYTPKKCAECQQQQSIQQK
jgi:hypothetical protein